MTQTTVNPSLSSFLQKYPTKKFNKGEIIIFQGEAPRSAYVVKSGVVKSYNLSINGDEKPVSFYEAGGLFPSAWAYKKTPSAVYYYEAFTADVEIYCVPRDDYTDFIHASPEYMAAELDRLVVDHLAASMRLNALQHSRAGDKLIYTLHYLTVSHGTRVADSRDITIELDLTHQDFANLTGLTRETAATELHKLKKNGIISYGKGKPYVVHQDKLTATLNDQYIADLQVLAG